MTTVTPDTSVLSPGVQPEPLLSELSRSGAPGHQLPALDVPEVDDLGGQLLRLVLDRSQEPGRHLR